nr:hypothetical protein [uncultured Sphingobacterium sp.]
MMNNNQMNFAFFSANLHHYVPSIPWEDHNELYAIFKRYHTARNPERYMSTIEGLNGLTQAGILTGFHLGQHELLPLYLARAGIDFDILISKKVYQKYQNHLNAHRASFDDADRHFDFLFAEDKYMVLRIKRSLYSGRHILVFADGNIGANDIDGLFVPVSFFYKELHVRRGVAFISHLLQVPVYPVLDQLTDEMVKITIQQPIHPSFELARTDYIRECMQRIFDVLSERLNDKWMDWGCWDYLHQNGMLRLNGCEDVSGKLLSPEHTFAFRKGAKTFILDRFNYNIFIL